MRLLSLPLLAIPLVLYNVLVIAAGAPPDARWSVSLPSGAAWGLSMADALVILSLLLLFIELAKSTRTSNSSILDHALSVVVFAACLVEFVVVRAAGTTTFFLLLLMTLMDVVAGFMVTITGARRDYAR